MPRNIVNLLMAFLVFAVCACTKKVYVPVETQSESERYVEKEVERCLIDTVKVYVEVPAQSATIVTPDTISHLETDYAESFARWSNGMLYHSLSNKAAAIPMQVGVPRVEKEKHTERTDTITIRVPYEKPVYVAKPPDKWTRIKIDAFWWLLGGLAGCLAFLFRSPLKILMRKLV